MIDLQSLTLWGTSGHICPDGSQLTIPRQKFKIEASTLLTYNDILSIQNLASHIFGIIRR